MRILQGVVSERGGLEGMFATHPPTCPPTCRHCILTLCIRSQQKHRAVLRSLGDGQGVEVHHCPLLPPNGVLHLRQGKAKWARLHGGCTVQGGAGTGGAYPASSCNAVPCVSFANH